MTIIVAIASCKILERRDVNVNRSRKPFSGDSGEDFHTRINFNSPNSDFPYFLGDILHNMAIT